MDNKRKSPDLRTWRERHGLDQRTAAFRLGMSQPTYSRIENGRYARSFARKAKRIAKLTGVPVESILGL
jgi:transcriptional regulator with XRE-family HTH domain